MATPNTEKVIKEKKIVLAKEQGLFAVSESWGFRFGLEHDSYPDNQVWITKGELIQAIVESGKALDFMSSLFYAMNNLKKEIKKSE